MARGLRAPDARNVLVVDTAAVTNDALLVEQKYFGCALRGQVVRELIDLWTREVTAG